VTEPVSKLSREMCIAAKAASVSNLAEVLICGQLRPAMQKTRGLIKTERIDEFTAGRAALREQFLQIAQ
jgi:hypothetical protein